MGEVDWDIDFCCLNFSIFNLDKVIWVDLMFLVVIFFWEFFDIGRYNMFFIFIFFGDDFGIGLGLLILLFLFLLKNIGFDLDLNEIRLGLFFK